MEDRKYVLFVIVEIYKFSGWPNTIRISGGFNIKQQKLPALLIESKLEYKKYK